MRPEAAKHNSKGQLVVSDLGNHRIQVFDEKGELITLFGKRGTALGEFDRPTDLDIGPDGRIYVVDFGNDRIQVFGPLSGECP